MKKTQKPRLWLSNLRKSKGWSQKKLGDITKLSESYIRLIEIGERTPKPPAALRIGNALGLSKQKTLMSFYSEEDSKDS